MENFVIFKERVCEYIISQINKERQLKHQSLKTFSQNCSITISTMKNLGRAHLSSLDKICNYLDISMYELLDHAINYAKQNPNTLEVIK